LSQPNQGKQTYVALQETPFVSAAGADRPVYSYAANFCIAVNGGFGNGGMTFIGPSFAVPAKGTCTPWAGFTNVDAGVLG
jgi:hypothetical protein